ncbi:MAG TPA: hypothetical protein VNG12_22960 [Acidimicrobiales bacterium]|nr:hypothetical protein [Acidimicrobiales bacterium]
MSRHRLRTARHGEEGVALILVLTFIALFGLLIGALLAFSGASINVTLANRGQRSRLYTAGAGIDGAVENIRGTATIGRDDGSACPTFNAGAFANNLDVSVTCAPQVGSGGGNANGPHQVPNAPAYSAWAVPPFGQLPSGTDEGVIGCGSGDAVIQGNVASTDVVTSGTGGCASGNLTVSGYTDARSEKGSVVTQGGCNCFDSDPPGDPNYPQASSTIPAPAPAPACLASAAEFFPGTYTSAPAATGCSALPEWFSPGNYYFDFTTLPESTHTWDLSTGTVIGGTPNGWDPKTAGSVPPPSHACKQEHDPLPTDGVQFLFGGDTRVDLGAAGHLELCAEPSATAQEIAVYGVKTPTGPSSPTQTDLDASSASSTKFTPPAAALAIDGTPATASIDKGATATVTLTGMAPLPQGALVEQATLRVVHADPGVGTLNIAVTDGLGNEFCANPGSGGCGGTATAVPALCATQQPMPPHMHMHVHTAQCTGTSLKFRDTSGEDDIDLTPYLDNDPSQIGGLSVTFSAQGQPGATATEALDGIDLQVTYELPGGFRQESGCLANLTNIGNPTPGVPAALQPCSLLSDGGSFDAGFGLDLQGTLYAPLAMVRLSTASCGDGPGSIRFNRGIIARNIVLLSEQTNSSVACVGEPDRYVLFTATVRPPSGPAEVLTSLVDFDDQSDVYKPGSNITFLSWQACPASNAALCGLSP